MMKNKGKVIVRIILTIALFLGILVLLGLLLHPKYATGVREGAMTQDYYLEENDHDVIFLGDCEVYENFSPVTLWEKYGITSYVRGNSQQLIWQSYALLEETFEYETPEIVIFNVHSMRFSEPQNEAYNRMALDGMKWSKYKVEAILASMTEGESFLSYVFPVIRYHDRWNALTQDDLQYMFHHEPSTVAGYLIRADIEPLSRLPQSPILEDPEFSDVCWDYLDKIKMLCEENGTELILIKSSSIWPTWYDEWDEQIVSYAEENGLTYINFIDLQEEIGIDFSTDTYDSGLHLNVYGAEKAASYLGQYLTENYDLTDHRNDPIIAADWTEKSERYDEIISEQLRELEEYGTIKSWLPSN